ncbi:amino acid/polyamine transporter I [Talaromyces proteolyticus]|uniref:Amino acid/polyamine transporter I n=1 Tax=Talaromyces proteolyticus TaxID=1131652 RepID=A0AAD4Q0Q3_9EURO|nr:amino acid/polyamine transporter I [Talaromyces proteolyticus]KAH8701089.1 amino acid/polyamine transporter I [Talaromyces proteolyticus]
MAGTVRDRDDMLRIGREQELNRNFRFLSVLGFTAVLMCTWEAVLIGSSYGLTDGGAGGMIYTYIGGVLGFSAVVLSMAEMASIAPTSGGQYHWVSEFAPRKCQKFLSYITGWVCVLGWHTGIALCSYTVANMLTGLLTINYPETYDPKPWHGTVLVIAVASTAFVFNTFLAQKLPIIEGMILIIHVFGFFAVLIPLWVLAPRKTPSQVFLSVEDRGGWGDNGLSCLVGLVAPVYALIGPDSAVHMAEEIRDASWTLPLGMVWTLIINGVTGLVMIITYAFCVGDIDEVLASSTGFPFIQVFLNATGSVQATTGLTILMMLLQFCATISNVATSSRQLFAFARDDGFPYSKFLSHVNRHFMVPLNALCIGLIIVCLLSLVNIGSSVAFNAIMSLGTASLLSSYIISTFCLRLKRWRGEPIPPARWSLGPRWAPIIETVALIFLSLVWVLCFFPVSKDVTAGTMNWSVAIFGGVIIVALVYYYFSARHVYLGPVSRIRTMV